MGQPDQLERYQASATVLLALLKMPAAWYQLSILFLAQEVKFRCTDSASQDRLVLNKSDILNAWDGSCSYQIRGRGPLHKCEHWEYDRTELESTINMAWDMVCDNKLQVTWSQFSFMSCVFTGNLLGGLLANRVGRKPVLGVAVVCLPIFSAAASFSPNLTYFMVLRGLMGLALGGTIVMSFVLGGEQAKGSWRPAITILHQVPFGIGQVILPVAAFFLRDWRQLQMALSVCSLIFIPYCWLIEESPLWLESTGSFKRAERVSAVIRRRNKLPESVAHEMLPIANMQKPEIVKTVMKTSDNQNENKLGLCGIFRHPLLCRYSVSVWLMWYFAGLAFFSLNAYQTSLGGDNFINVGVGGLVGGIPGNVLTVFLVRKFGRKYVIIIAHLLAAIAALLIPIYDVGEIAWDWTRRVSALSCLMFMSVAYPAVFLASGELIPGVVRAPVLGVANLMARLGNAMAPLVIPTARLHRWAPLWVVAAAPFLTAVIMSTLPETNNKPLPGRIEDLEVTQVEIKQREKNGKIYNPPSINIS